MRTHFYLPIFAALLLFVACQKHSSGGCQFKLTVNGYAGDCWSQPISGTVSILLDGSTYTGKIVNGKYSVTIPRCSVTKTPIKITTTDSATTYTSTQDVFNDTTAHQVDTGTFVMDSLNACPYDQYLSINIPNVYGVYVLAPFNGQINWSATSTQMHMDGYPFTTADLGLNFTAVTGPGTYVLSSFYASLSHNTVVGSNGTLNITSLDPVGGYIRGNFSGQVHYIDGGFYYGDTTTLHPATGNFQVKRTQ
jgi:hypothetical protein